MNVQWTKQQQANTLAAIDVMKTYYQWTKQQQANTLPAIDVMKTYCKAEREASAGKVLEHAEDVGAEGIIAGLSNLCAILVNHVATLTGEDRLAALYKAEEVAKNVTIVG